MNSRVNVNVILTQNLFNLHLMYKAGILFSLACTVVIAMTCAGEKPDIPQQNLSVSFYNIDNLYDTVDDTGHFDNDFTPKGKYQWTTMRYKAKLKNMAKVISTMCNGSQPDILGVCEIESAIALKDLIKTAPLKASYRYVHYDSPDERGVDVALVYNSDKLTVIKSEKIAVSLTKDKNDRTRDQLCVSLLAKGAKDTLHVYVCHFPSRKEGKNESEQNRIDAARTCINYLNSHFNTSKDKIIIMGDFNDEPWDKSIARVIGAKNIYKNDSADLLNLMYSFKQEGRGSYKFRGNMNMLDQLIISNALHKGNKLTYIAGTANIFDADWLTQKGKYAGYPLRTFGGNQWLNGYSDHYPVSLYLKW